jgi:pimeloyl-ACP methyl ester carboxylesterase
MLSPSVTFHTAQLRTGVTLRYAAQGASDAPAVLMLHGVTDSWFSFSRVLSLLPPDVRAIVPDQRGHGESDKTATEFTLDAMAADAAALLDTLNISRAIVVGHSMGSLVAQRVAALASDRVMSLVLIASAVTARNDVIADLLDEVNKLEDPVSLDFITAFQASTIHRPVRRAFFDNVVNETAKVPARVWKSAFRSLYDSPPARVPASCPVSILWGDRDGLFSLWDQETLRRHIPNATFQALKDVGHAPHWEAPDLVIRDMVGILV